MRHSKSRCRSEHSDISELVEDADESAPVRLESRYIPDTSRFIGTSREQAGGTPTSREQAGPHLPRYIGIEVDRTR